MRFKVDENLPADVAQLLRAAGHDALTVVDQPLSRMRRGSDRTTREARRGGRVSGAESRVLIILPRRRHKSSVWYGE
jgi:hypothetical protein